MRTPIDYEEARREYIKRNVVFFGAFLGYVPAFVVFFKVGNWLGFSPLAPVVASTGWFLALIVASAWRTGWRCPRCDKRFYYKWWYAHQFSMKCVHCGLRPLRGYYQK